MTHDAELSEKEERHHQHVQEGGEEEAAAPESDVGAVELEAAKGQMIVGLVFDEQTRRLTGIDTAPDPMADHNVD